MDAELVGVEALRSRVGLHCRYTQPFNFTGQPAISVPVGVTSDGLPIGVQMVGAPGGELVLLEVAAELETVLAWPERWPAVAEQHQ
jgi:amidase